MKGAEDNREERSEWPEKWLEERVWDSKYRKGIVHCLTVLIRIHLETTKDMVRTLELILRTVTEERYRQGSTASSASTGDRKASSRVSGT